MQDELSQFPPIVGTGISGIEARDRGFFKIKDARELFEKLYPAPECEEPTPEKPPIKPTRIVLCQPSGSKPNPPY